MSRPDALPTLIWTFPGYAEEVPKLVLGEWRVSALVTSWTG